MPMCTRKQSWNRSVLWSSLLACSIGWPVTAGAVDGGDYLLWQSSFGAHAQESADLLILNRCRFESALLVTHPSVSRDTDDRVTTSVLLGPGEAQALSVVVPVSSDDDGRRHVSVEIAAKTGRCASPGRNLIDAMIVVRGPDGGTRAVVHSSGLRSDGDLVQAVGELPSGGQAQANLMPIGTGEALELVATNGCPGPVLVHFQMRNLVSGEESISSIALRAGETAATVSYWEGGFVLIDVSDPSSPNAQDRCAPNMVTSAASVLGADGDTRTWEALRPTTGTSVGEPPKDQTLVDLESALTEAFACLAPLNGTPHLDQSSPPELTRLREGIVCQLEAAWGSQVINLSYGSQCTEACSSSQQNAAFVRVEGPLCSQDTGPLVFETKSGLNQWKREISRLCGACDEDDASCIFP